MNLKFEAEQCGVKEPHKPHPWRNQDILVQCAGVQDRVNHPSHYNSHPSGIEFITIGRHFNFNVGNAMKYLWRAGLKGEQGLDVLTKHVEDLKKAAWYIADEIARVEKLLAEPQLDQSEGKDIESWQHRLDVHNAKKIEDHIASLNEQIIASAPEGIVYSGGPDTQSPLDWNIEPPSIMREFDE